MKELFIEKNFRGKSLDIVNAANAIIAEYRKAGFTLTLRQLYYQFVARGLLLNKSQNYDRLGYIISDARLAGLVDWDSIEDRTRFLRGHTTFDSAADAIDDTYRRYRLDMWKDQATRLEVWIEKDALVGVIARVCAKWDINYFACRGYASQSELYTAGKRIRARRRDDKQNTIVIHLGDHDPSGIDMTRDNCDRLSLFAGHYVEVKRIALNMDQVKQYNPPPNPAKMTDSRFKEYELNYGDESWELDALEPKAIADMIEEEARAVIDFDTWEARELRYEQDRDKLLKAIDYVGEL
jgi:hypothetical protein